MQVKLMSNRRYFDSEDSNFFIQAGQEKELELKELKSYTIKANLMNGIFIVTKGEVVLNIKHAKVLFSAKAHPFCYGTEFGNFFKKDLTTQQVFWIDKDDITNLDPSIYTKLTGEEVPVAEAPVEEPEETPVEEPEEEPVSEEEAEEEAEEEEPSEEDEESEPEEEVSEEDEKYTKTDLYDMTKLEQVDILEEMGLSSSEIKALRNELNRVEKILELQG